MPAGANCILFDLDGTLLDTAADFTAVLNSMLAEHGCDTLDYDTVRQTVSDGARAMVSLAFNTSEEQPGFERLRREFLDRYERQLSVHTTPFDGMPELLTLLESASKPWGIVTNKPVLYTDKILDALALDQRCAVRVCPDHVTHTKPDPEPLLLACELLRQAPAECVYVGDHVRDIEAGRRAGMITIAAAYGYIHANEDIESWGADYVAHSVAELHNLLATGLRS